MAIPNEHHDATADFAAALADPTRWAIKRGVPVFKPHQRTDPATGSLIKVDVPKLYRIAQNMQRLERMGGVPIRLTLGHTEPGKPETNQPPVGGYYRNARVQPFGPSGEPAIVVDEWLDPQYLPERKNFPYRSAEYYDDAEQITGVALLTRDPYLDLGVVAYSRGITGATHYGRTAVGVSPTVYQFLTAGESDMFPPAGSAPVVPATPPVPTPYNTWAGAGSSYNPSQTIPHPHTNTGAIYGMPNNMPQPMPPGQPPQPGFPPTMNDNMPPGQPPEDEESGLYALHHHLGQAVEHLSRYLGGKRSAKYGAPGAPPAPNAPTSPFPGQMPGGIPNSRYGKSDPDPGAVAAAEEENRRRNERGEPDKPIRNSAYGYAPPAGYGQQPGQYGRNPMPATGTTISGLPVGYQMALDQLQYKLNEQQRATQVLLYEREQADTEFCVSEIRRLATIGFPVGEYELNELKNKPREQREAYLQHICTKYSRVPGGEMPPPILGDPTPGVNPNMGRPANREEMDAALKMAASAPNDPNAFQNALNYIRTGAAPTTNGTPNRLAGIPAAGGGFPEPMPGEWAAGEPMPGMPSTFTDPYAHAQRNGY